MRMRGLARLRGLAFSAALLLPTATAAQELSVSAQGAVLAESPLHLEIELETPPEASRRATVFVDGRVVRELDLTRGSVELELPGLDLAPGSHRVTVRTADLEGETEIRTLPGWLSLVPPILAIALAILWKDVIISLFLGVFVGALALYDFSPTTAFARTIDTFIVSALADPDRAAILIFSVLLGGMVGVISKSGGTHGIVDRLTGFANSPERAQITAWLMGILVFFDDYANTLIVGSTMRPVTDRLRVSREKLAYIVDSTAAPVASLVPISTWIGYELGLIGDALAGIGSPHDPYSVLLASIPFRFYPIFALVLGLTVAITGRDLGPMRRAEARARRGELFAKGDVPLVDYSTTMETPGQVRPKALNAVLPILTVILGTVAGLYLTGSAEVSRADHAGVIEWLREVFSNANSYAALLWASLGAVIVALFTSLTTLRLKESVQALIEGFKSMLLALVVLLLAWSLGDVCSELHTADTVVRLTQGLLEPHWLPALVFLTSAAISFATGTSWATMAILIPLVIPTLHSLATNVGIAPGDGTYGTLLVGTISSVLAGSVWGDHCSPISDTTILSSMSSGCDHIAHVRTQVPYALLAAGAGLLLGDIPSAYGLPVWVSLLAGSAVLVAIVHWFGRRAEAA